MAVLNEHAGDLARYVSLNLIHQFHRLNDAEDLAGLNARAHGDERSGIRGGRRVERADDGRFYDMQVFGRRRWDAGRVRYRYFGRRGRPNNGLLVSDGRCCVGRRRGYGGGSCGLPEPDMNVALLILKFFQAVALHESQKALELAKIYPADEISARFLLLLFCHLEFEKVSRRGCEIRCPGFRNHDVVFDADAPDAIKIYAGLDCQYHPFLKDGLFTAA